MKTMSKLVAGVLIATTALTGCSSTTGAAESTSTDKDASMRGARICLTNSSGVPMSAGITGATVPENANTLVGKPGDLGTTELCFAGWNGIKTSSLYSDKEPGGGGEVNSTDVAVGVNIDGNYDQIKFRAFNGPLFPPVLWWLVQGGDVNNWGGGSFKENSSRTGTVDSHEFTVTRRDDSDNYKEFLIQFTK